MHLEPQWETTMYYFICSQKKHGWLDAAVSTSQLTLSLHAGNCKSFPSCPLLESPMVSTAAEWMGQRSWEAQATGPLRPKYMNLSLAMIPVIHIHSQLSSVDKNAQAHSYLQSSYPSISNMEKALQIKAIASDIFRHEYPIAKGLPWNELPKSRTMSTVYAICYSVFLGS